MKKQTSALSLGTLQTEVEASARALRAANTALAKALEAQGKSEAAYHAAQKTLTAAVDQLRQATKVL